MKRNEYPRPQFTRDKWQNLNGTWDFAFDDNNIGHKNNWIENGSYPLKIEVPFCFQSELSGICDQSFHDHIWYRRNIKLDDISSNERIILHIGACDYYTEIYVNKKLVCSHEGGHTAFSCDISDYVNFKNEEIIIYVFDPSQDKTLPRGKQYWKLEPEIIWYPRTTGLWQTIWIEYVPETYIKNAKMTSLYDSGEVKIDVTFNKDVTGDFKIEILEDEKIFKEVTEKVSGKTATYIIKIFDYNDNVKKQYYSWSPEHPFLFSINFSLNTDMNTSDFVKSYFGMRKVSFENGKFLLNNRPYFQKLILDQGYYPKSLMTAETDDDFINDIVLSKEMGFNGCRKHQTIADPRFLYHADKIGYLVWSEMANAFEFSKEYVRKIKIEWRAAIEQNYNHPSIVVWVPLNESWGIDAVSKNKDQQAHQLEMYMLTKSLDNTRLVSSNDGWEMMKTDICAIHNYSHGKYGDKNKINQYTMSLHNKENILKYPPTKRPIYIDGYNNNEEPFILTEFGGIAFDGNSNGWGYTSVENKEIFVKEYSRLIEAIRSSNVLVGFCYTQLTDVYQEKNGLLYENRVPKIDSNIIKKINDSIKTL